MSDPRATTWDKIANDEDFDEKAEFIRKKFDIWLDNQNTLLSESIETILQEAFFAGYETRLKQEEEK